MKSQILTEIYKSHEVKKMIQSLRPIHLQQDILQHCFLELFEKDEKFIVDLYDRGKLKNYIVKTLYNTARFTRSKFHKELGNEIPVESFADIPVEVYEEIKVDLSKLYWYKKEILELYAKEGTYQRVSDLTHIPLTSVYKTVIEARKEIKKQYYDNK